MTEDLRGPVVRAAGGALLVACLLLLGFAAVLLVEDRDTVTTLLVLFAVVSVPALVSAVFGLGAGARALRAAELDRSTAAFAGLLALGHVGIVALSLRPGLDRALGGGDLLGATVGATGAMAALTALAVALPGRTLAVRLVAALGAGVLVLALLVLRVVAEVD
jgi:hypothetical protein